MAVTQTDCLRPISKRLLDSAPSYVLHRQALPPGRMLPVCALAAGLLVSSMPVPTGCCQGGRQHLRSVRGQGGLLSLSQHFIYVCPLCARQLAFPPPGLCNPPGALILPLANRELQLLEIQGRPHPWFPAQALPTLGYLRQNQIYNSDGLSIQHQKAAYSHTDDFPPSYPSSSLVIAFQTTDHRKCTPCKTSVPRSPGSVLAAPSSWSSSPISFQPQRNLQ